MSRQNFRGGFDRTTSVLKNALEQLREHSLYIGAFCTTSALLRYNCRRHIGQLSAAQRHIFGGTSAHCRRYFGLIVGVTLTQLSALLRPKCRRYFCTLLAYFGILLVVFRLYTWVLLRQYFGSTSGLYRHSFGTTSALLLSCFLITHRNGSGNVSDLHWYYCIAMP